MKKIIYLLFIYLSVVLLSLTSCIEDGFSNSPSDQPVFSTDTLDLGVVFTDTPTPTSRMLIHNPHSKGMILSRVSLSGEGAQYFRLNVDGIPGREFDNVEIRNRDSVFVLVEATLPENGSDFPAAVTASLDVTVSGVTNSVILKATGQDVHRIKGDVLTGDVRLSAGRPYQIFDSLTVAEGATLTLDPGVTLCFHDGAMLIVRGSLQSLGTVEKPVVMAGDRTGNVVADISFDIMSRQWTGVFFTATSTASRMENTVVKNTWQGVTVSGDGATEEPALTLINCRLRNSGGLVLESLHSNIKAIGCEFAEGGGGLVAVHGGKATFNHCTFANNYLFSAISGPALGFSHLGLGTDLSMDDDSGLPAASVSVTNSIIYGLGADVFPGDLTGADVRLERCLIKSKGSDDENFIDCLWDADPLYYTVRNDYYFDYRLQPDSPAIGAANPALTLQEASVDGYGLRRGSVPDLGAYVFTPAE